MNNKIRLKQCLSISLLALMPLSILNACSSDSNNENKPASTNSFYHVKNKNKDKFTVNGVNNAEFKVDDSGAIQKVVTNKAGNNTIKLPKVSDLGGKAFLTNSDGYSLMTVPVNENIKDAKITLKSSQIVPTTHGVISQNNKYYAVFVMHPIIQEVNISNIQWSDSKGYKYNMDIKK